MDFDFVSFHRKARKEFYQYPAVLSGWVGEKRRVGERRREQEVNERKGDRK